LKETHSANKLAAVGFWYPFLISKKKKKCFEESSWGAMGTILLAATDLVEGGVVHHPAFLSIPDDIEKISKVFLSFVFFSSVFNSWFHFKYRIVPSFTLLALFLTLYISFSQ
jgi:hypothetical protein